MGEEFNSSQPIYHQIVQKICRQIVRGELVAGQKLPSVRDMAMQMGVNPNTVQRVYTELEQMAIAAVRRGQGTFVTEDEARLRALRDELMAEHITTFLKDMSEMGFSEQEIVSGVQLRLQTLAEEN